MKKHICNKEKTVEVEGYIAIRENKVVYVEPHKRCRPTNKKQALLGAVSTGYSFSYLISKILNNVQFTNIISANNA